MAASLTSKLQSLSQELTQTLQSPRNKIAATLITAISLPAIYYTYLDYRAWLSVGRGGLPHNILGYLLQALLSPLKASRFDTSFVSKPRILAKSGPAGERAYLKDEDVPERKGERPDVCGWILPQRQLDQKAGERSRAVSVFLV